MKTRFTILAALLLSAACARAADFVTANDYILASNATLNAELWLHGQSIVIAGTARDDLLLLADTGGVAGTNAAPTGIHLDGVMKADVWALSDTIRLTGEVANHARLVGLRTVRVQGRVGRGLMAVGNAIHVTDGAEIGGDATLLAKDIIVEGHVAGKTVLRGAAVTLSGTFDGDVDITAPEITVSPNTRIAGNLTYLMDKELITDSSVSVGGKLIRRKIEPATVSEGPFGGWLLQGVLFFGALMAGLLFVSLFPGFVALSVNKLDESRWRCLLLGFIAFGLVPMAAALLLFTLVGIPLSFVLALAYGLLLYLSKIPAALYLAQLIVRRKGQAPAMTLLPLLALGLFAAYVGVNLPAGVGIVVWFGFTLLGMGAMVGAILDRRTPVVVAVPSGVGPQPPPLAGGNIV